DARRRDRVVVGAGDDDRDRAVEIAARREEELDRRPLAAALRRERHERLAPAEARARAGGEEDERRPQCRKIQTSTPASRTRKTAPPIASGSSARRSLFTGWSSSTQLK